MFGVNGEVVYQCEGCANNNVGQCLIWLSPEAKFHGRNDCGLSTHIVKRIKIQEDGKKRLTIQKKKKTRK